jgi:energy-coupling factor transporter ATP-binding protein EcfA2
VSRVAAGRVRIWAVTSQQGVGPVVSVICMTEFEDEKKIAQQVQRLMWDGWSDSAIVIAMGAKYPSLLRDEVLRQAAVGRRGELPPFSPEHLGRLRLVLRRSRREYLRDAAHAQRLAAGLGGDEDQITHLGEVKESPVVRFSTTQPEIDNVFGSALPDEDVLGDAAGVARGRTYLLGGERGAGKTRLFTALAIIMVERLGMKVVVQTLEMSKGEYKNLVMSMYRAAGIEPKHVENFYVLRNFSWRRQVQAIKEIAPDWAVVDSFSMMPGHKKEDMIDDVLTNYKLAMGTKTSALFVNHLAKDGTIGGSSYLQHSVDACMQLSRDPAREWETVQEGAEDYLSDRLLFKNDKNRMGPSGASCSIQHFLGRLRVVPSPEEAPVRLAV